MMRLQVRLTPLTLHDLKYINANAETFLGYTTGSYRWQIGPQIRYQMLPSLVDKYPNKEYLFNYGLKVGVVKQLK